MVNEAKEKTVNKTQIVAVMTIETRSNLVELLKQLELHGPGGGSRDLSQAMNAFDAYSMHDLSVKLTKMLLLASVSLQSEFGGMGGTGAG